jgi:sulfur transfer complex TusBCD TusB component (DsrH family)
LDINRFDFDNGVYELIGIDVSNNYTSTITKDTSNIEIITTDVSFGNYTVKMNFYDASGLFVTPKYEASFSCGNPNDITSSSIISNLSNIVHTYTDTTANITLSFNIDTTLYEYDIINVKIVGTDISEVYSGDSSTPNILLNNVPLGSNDIEITLLTNEGLYVAPIQREILQVLASINENLYKDSIDIIKRNDNGNLLKVKVNIIDNEFININNIDRSIIEIEEVLTEPYDKTKIVYSQSSIYSSSNKPASILEMQNGAAT